MDVVYEHEGATWLRTTKFGDQKDRVMVRSSGLPTYFLPDVAYHMTKWTRGFERVINVQGSDHHGTVDRVRAGVQALGLPKGYPEYVLHQMVRVVREGREVKFSKRIGGNTTLRELYDEVGTDVTRYFFQMRKPDAQMVFDLDAALDYSEKNPLYKIQYAHARMHSIFAKAQLIPEDAWYHAGNPSRNPELAVLVKNPKVRSARLILARSLQIVLQNGLTILGINAPKRMRQDIDNHDI